MLPTLCVSCGEHLSVRTVAPPCWVSCPNFLFVAGEAARLRREFRILGEPRRASQSVAPLVPSALEGDALSSHCSSRCWRCFDPTDKACLWLCKAILKPARSAESGTDVSMLCCFSVRVTCLLLLASTGACFNGCQQRNFLFHQGEVVRSCCTLSAVVHVTGSSSTYLMFLLNWSPDCMNLPSSAIRPQHGLRARCSCRLHAAGQGCPHTLCSASQGVSCWPQYVAENMFIARVVSVCLGSVLRSPHSACVCTLETLFTSNQDSMMGLAPRRCSPSPPLQAALAAGAGGRCAARRCSEPQSYRDSTADTRSMSLHSSTC